CRTPRRRSASCWSSAPGTWRRSRCRSGSSSSGPCLGPPAARSCTATPAGVRGRLMTGAAPEDRPDKPGGSPAGRRLSATDRAMLGVDGVLRDMGAPGFETQTLVWLDRRLDAGRLGAALARLGALHPVAAARLVEDGGGPWWRFRPGAGCPLRETRLESDE